MRGDAGIDARRIRTVGDALSSRAGRPGDRDGVPLGAGGRRVGRRCRRRHGCQAIARVPRKGLNRRPWEGVRHRTGESRMF